MTLSRGRSGQVADAVRSGPADRRAAGPRGGGGVARVHAPAAARVVPRARRLVVPRHDGGGCCSLNTRVEVASWKLKVESAWFHHFFFILLFFFYIHRTPRRFTWRA